MGAQKSRLKDTSIIRKRIDKVTLLKGKMTTYSSLTSWASVEAEGA